MSLRRRLLLTAWLGGSLCLLARAVQLQVVDVDVWRAAALEQHQTHAETPAARGTILDRDGVPLVMSRETYRVAVATREVEDRAAAEAALREVLGLTERAARAQTDPSDPWRVVPGHFEPGVREALAGVRGIHLERELRRTYPHGDLARGVLGRVVDGSGMGGIEQAFDDRLRGRAGREVLARDSEGRPIPGEILQVEPPRPGDPVRLTLDADLQEIAEEALSTAVERNQARGGDLIISDPATGEILALASMKDGRSDALSAINAPYEPGSTLKPFTVAAILARGKGELGDTVDAERGRWMAPDGRPLSDVHPHGRITLADALRVSSNVGIAKAALHLTPAEQYQNLRDFGFGGPTGISLPGEAAGLLRRPDRWTARSPVSLAIGYEVSVTPLQMAMAYGALANGGTLMEPRLVQPAGGGREVGGEDAAPRAVRRVVPREVAQRLGRVLERVVEDGTGTEARLGRFAVAGKSGTSRAYRAGAGYESGRYFASFAGFFPAEDPQLVVFVKLDSPRGSYYGGTAAAPVTRETMEAVLAARTAPIDRAALVAATRPERRGPPLSAPPSSPGPAGSGDIGLRFASVSLPDEAGDGTSTASASTTPGVGRTGSVPVPDVLALPPRAAVRRLHGVGLRVRWEGEGRVARTVPAAGQYLLPGDTVSFRSGPPAGTAGTGGAEGRRR